MSSPISSYSGASAIFFAPAQQEQLAAYLFIVALLIAAYVLLRYLRMIWRLLVYPMFRQIIRKTWRTLIGKPDPKPFSVTKPADKRILIVGDSTAFGTGAARPEDSVAGRLSRDFPDTEILNYAVNGSLTTDALVQLENADGQAFDLVILSTGGNDIWHFTRLKKIRVALQAALEKATALSNHRVIVLLYANFGSSPLFPPLLRAILQRRTEKVRRLYVDVCAKAKVPYIDLYTAQGIDSFEINPFQQAPKEYFAPDFMHPSSEGYGLWYRRMWRVMVENGWFFKEQTAPYVLKK